MSIRVFRFLCWLVFAGAVAPWTVAEDAPTPVPTSGTEVAEPDDEATPPAVEPGAAEYWQAVKVLWSKQATEQAEGRRLLEASADLEFTHAQLLLGECYQSGSLGFKKNAKKGAALFRLAAERGNAFAAVSYGVCLFGGVGVRKDLDKAFEWMTAAVAPNADYSRPQRPADFVASDDASDAKPDSGSEIAGAVITDPVAEAQARAHLILGIIAEKRNQMEAAQAHYVAAATAGPAGRSGIYPAAVQAAVNYAFGHGVPRDLAKANEMLEQSRKLVRRAGISLVHNFADQKLVDDFAVSELEEQVADASDEAGTELQFQIASTFGNAKSKDYNPQEAVKWFELAAESNKPWAMLELAFIYTRGDLGTPDPAKAFTWFEKAGAEDGGNHVLGAVNTAICLEQGIGTAADPKRAMQLYQKHRDSNIVAYLGTIGAAPKTVVTYEDTVALNELWAKKKNDAHAEYLLGLRYAQGWGVKADTHDAVRWWKRAAKAGSGSADRELGLQMEREGDLKDALDYYNEATRLGDARATTRLAALYQFGRGVTRDESEAIQLYEKALTLDPESSDAMNNLGLIYEGRFKRDTGEFGSAPATGPNREKMLEYYTKADDAGSAYAAFNLGELYYDGTLGEKDYVQAYTYFDKAAERGHVVARYRLGLMHELGQGVDVTYAEAAYHYRLAALEGHRDALRHLVQLYLQGKGVSQDLDRAQFWLARLAGTGEMSAIPTMADVLLQKKEYPEAVRLLNLLKNYPLNGYGGFAYERLSSCYEHGWGVKADPKRAQQYLDKALELGDHDAQYRQGMNLMRENKSAEAVSWFERAAVDSGAANFALGQMNFFGQHMDKNLEQAWKYLRRAAELNHPDALYFLAGTTFNRVDGAPTIDEAIKFAQQAENAGLAKAAALREKLEKRRQEQEAAPEESTRTRST